MDGIALGYSCIPPENYKTTFQAKGNTKMHGINWNNGKLDYPALTSFIYQPFSPTTFCKMT